MKIVTLAALVSLSVGTVVYAQIEKDRLTILERSDLSAPGREAVVAIDEIEPTAVSGWHTHPGEMIGFVTDGLIVIEQRGEEPRTVLAGESFVIPAGVPHSSRNAGRMLARMFVTFIVEKDKPLTTPVAAQ